MWGLYFRYKWLPVRASRPFVKKPGVSECAINKDVFYHISVTLTLTLTLTLTIILTLTLTLPTATGTHLVEEKEELEERLLEMKEALDKERAMRGNDAKSQMAIALLQNDKSHMYVL